MSCPVCSSNNILDNFQEIKIEHNYLAKSGDILKISCCVECGFIYQNPILEIMQNISHYEDFTKYASEETKGHKLAKLDQLNWIERILKDNGELSNQNKNSLSIYEIGASVGAFLVHAKEMGWSVGGLEPSQQAITAALNNHDIEIDKGFIGDCSQISSNIIAMFHVFQDIINPVQCLQHLHKITPENCYLFVEVPNMSWPDNCPAGMYWHPENVNYFSPENIVLAGKNAGWNSIYLDSISYPEKAHDYCAYPALRIVFLKRSNERTIEMKQNAVSIIETQMTSEEKRISELLHDFITNKSPEGFVIFGAGGHTGMLLNFMDNYSKSKIIAIVDSNPKTIGMSIGENTVEISSQIHKYKKYGCVISSQGYQTQIKDFIEETNGKDAKILIFY